jgi:hypothetical protein
LLLEFAQKRLHKEPYKMALVDLDPPLIGAFLDELEKHRGNSARSRNLRLTAIRSFFHYADSGMDRAATAGGVSVGRRTAFLTARPRPHLRF